MMLKKWDDLPDFIKNDSVRSFYDVLHKKQTSLIFKRVFDLIIAIFTFVILFPVLIILCVVIKFDSDGPILFRQLRITQYGKRFLIFKFRTMIKDAEKYGAQVTINNDTRITKVGKILRKYRLDEIPQLFNIINGDMCFVGTRPEVVKYVEQYSDVMMATLLLPAGVTSEASILYKDENKILGNTNDVDRTYLEIILPEKMKYNLASIKSFCFFGDIRTMAKTVIAITKRA